MQDLGAKHILQFLREVRTTWKQPRVIVGGEVLPLGSITSPEPLGRLSPRAHSRDWLTSCPQLTLAGVNGQAAERPQQGTGLCGCGCVSTYADRRSSDRHRAHAVCHEAPGF